MTQRQNRYTEVTMHDPQDMKQNGFSLVELSVVLVVIGLMVGAAASLVGPYVDSYRYNSTQKKMDQIADALAIYAQRHYDLPCPADPNPTTEPHGTPRGSGADGNDTSVKCVNAGGYIEHGIVPYKVLGLTEDQVKDAYGRYISYTLPRVWDRYKGNNDRTDDVHRACRTRVWIDPASGRNLNLAKARFCCPRPPSSHTGSASSLLFIRDSAQSGGQFVWQNPYSYYQSNDFGNPDTLSNNTTSTRSFPQVIAFILVSHGKNGFGAYMPNGAMRVKNSSIPGGGDDVKNANGATGQTKIDINFVMKPLNTNLSANGGRDYFDDIVVFRTNLQLISRFGNQSCARP